MIHNDSSRVDPFEFQIEVLGSRVRCGSPVGQPLGEVLMISEAIRLAAGVQAVFAQIRHFAAQRHLGLAGGLIEAIAWG
jgi:hypothetical protein